MYYYFSSAYPAVIKLNGIYYGTISDTIKSINIDGKLPLVEVCPLGTNERQVTFFPDTDFLLSPPDGVLVTDLNGGYLLKFLKTTKVGDFKVIEQKRFSSFLATVFIENGLKVSIETQSGFFADTIDLCAEKAEIVEFSLNGCVFCAITFKGDENFLAVFEISEQIKRVFFKAVSDCAFDGGFYTTETFSDIAKHVVKSEWEFTNGAFTKKHIHVERAKDFDLLSLNKKILPFAFLEELLVCGNISEFLADNLKENADKLKSYLGDFIGIMPPPIFRAPDEIGLIYQRGKNKYIVKYCTFDIDNNKICNLKLIEN